MATIHRINPEFDFNLAGKQDRNKESTPIKDPIVEFRSFLFSNGYSPPEIIPDGEIHRFKGPTDRQGKDSAWYIMHIDSPQAGIVGDWKEDRSKTWCIKNEADMTYEEKASYRQKIDSLILIRQQEQKTRHSKARIKAQKVWSEAQECVNHPYLQLKQIKPFGVKIHQGMIIWPLMDSSGVIHSYQTISPTGDKRFLTGGKKKGCFFSIPGSAVFAIVEGLATGASIHEATGWTVIVAVDAGNLLPVAETIRKNNPMAEIIICADNDVNGVGQAKAQEAGQAISATVKTPREPGADWNDIHVKNGLETLKQELFPKPFRTVITDWTIDRYAGPAPERKWLVDFTIPSAALTILSAQGDAGKGMMLLDLGLKVAGGEAGSVLRRTEAFGNDIQSFGAVVIITAEDDKDEMHRRIEGVRKNRVLKHPIYIVPLPNAGGPMPFVVPGKHGPQTGERWHEITEQLKAIHDLQLIVIDPLASFILADVNADPAVGAFTTGLFASLATETGAAVLVAHHLAKTKTKISTPEEARVLVRGSTAIVDGARAVYVLWGSDEKEGKTKCKHLGVEWQRNKIFFGCLVKANGPGDRKIKTYARNDCGLLEVVDLRIQQAAKDDKAVLLDMLEDDIRFFAELGHPFSKTGANGLYSQRFDLHPSLHEISAHKFIAYTDVLKDQKRIVSVAPKGNKLKNYLDVPNGMFASGNGEILSGKRPEREW